MQVIEINKRNYRKRLNIAIGTFVSVFFVLSLLFGSTLISVFSPNTQVSEVLITEPISDSTAETSNFKYNLAGVVLALLFCTILLNFCKNKAFFNEIYYVWQLKQLHNLIYRKFKKIAKAADEYDVNALIILNFYYQTRKQVYLLDDNTLTLTSIERDIEALYDKLAYKKLTISLEQFNKNLLLSF